MNALKFSNPGSDVLLHAFSKESGKQTHCFIKVIDKGTNSEEGTGFGMPLVKRYVEHTHGTIEVQSIEASAQVTEDSAGTTVKIVFLNQSVAPENHRLSPGRVNNQTHAGLN